MTMAISLEVVRKPFDIKDASIIWCYCPRLVVRRHSSLVVKPVNAESDGNNQNKGECGGLLTAAFTRTSRDEWGNPTTTSHCHC